MEIFFILWLLFGFFSGLFLTYLDYKNGLDITLGHVLATILLSLGGFILAIPIMFIIAGNVVLIRGEK